MSEDDLSPRQRALAGEFVKEGHSMQDAVAQTHDRIPPQETIARHVSDGLLNHASILLIDYPCVAEALRELDEAMRSMPSPPDIRTPAFRGPQPQNMDLIERLQGVVDHLEEEAPDPKPYDFYYPVKNEDAHGWSYFCVGFGITEIKEAIAALKRCSGAPSPQDVQTPAEMAQEFARGAFGPFGVDTAPYAAVIEQLIELAISQHRAPAAEARRCQKCGAPTNGEEALVNGQSWCHPCADGAAGTHEPFRTTAERIVQAEQAKCHGELSGCIRNVRVGDCGEAGGSLVDAIACALEDVADALRFQVPVAWIAFAGNGNIRFWTADESRANDEKARGLDIRAFTLPEIVALAARSHSPAENAPAVTKKELATFLYEDAMAWAPDRQSKRRPGNSYRCLADARSNLHMAESVLAKFDVRRRT